jgi:hypothetical protein
MTIAEQLIQQYGLRPHPEGGWYAQTYRSPELIPATALPARFGGNRPFSTAIYFLLEQGDFSAFHRIKSDECWHFYKGGALEVYMLWENGPFAKVELGTDFSKGQVFQFVVPAGCWFASRPAAGSKYSFVGCTVAPGFDFNDFELATMDGLVIQFPGYRELIRQLCR